jgi:glycosyltransferase involved in cell wall biosynthesis
MIVKNEAHIIRETLDSVAPYISSWVIVDTGSDDGTQDLIRDHMGRRGIPGELYERPWRNFGHNRSEALDLAQGHVTTSGSSTPTTGLWAQSISAG